jgi:hypothetical protein
MVMAIAFGMILRRIGVLGTVSSSPHSDFGTDLILPLDPLHGNHAFSGLVGRLEHHERIGDDGIVFGRQSDPPSACVTWPFTDGSGWRDGTATSRKPFVCEIDLSPFQERLADRRLRAELVIPPPRVTWRFESPASWASIVPSGGYGK